MAFYVKFRDKRQLGGSDSLYCWRYEISTDAGEFGEGDRWGLAFNTDVDIKTPDNYTDCGDYNLGFKGTSDAPTHWIASTTLPVNSSKVDLAFIAPGRENKDAFITLERWSAEYEIWIQEKFRGWNEMLGPAGDA